MWFGVVFFFFFKQKTAYEIGTGDWSSDVCSSDLVPFLAIGRRLTRWEGGALLLGYTAYIVFVSTR